MKAFPMAHPSVECRFIDSGMDLRDYFAGLALEGLLANGTIGVNLPPKNVCERAYAHADWMMKVRDEK